jgi:outer membrane lipase/esterase
MVWKQLVLVPVLMITLWFAPALGAPYHSSLIVFGDSLSDTGNDFIASRGAIPASPYYQGRFSNGPTYLDQLARNLGLPSTPSLAGGTNTAFGGARTNRQSFSPAFSILNQVQAYVDHTPVADPQALFVLFGGANNLQDVIPRAAADPSNAATLIHAAIQQTVGDLSTMLDRLTAIGARTIVVPNAPNLGLTPRFNEPGPNVGALARSVTQSFNEAFDTMLNTHTGAHLIRVDSFGFFNSLAANPEMFGLTNVTARCYTGDDLTFTSGGSVCENPASFLFWDGIHPSSVPHRLFGDFVTASVVPEPETAILLLTGIAILISARLRVCHHTSPSREVQGLRVPASHLD